MRVYGTRGALEMEILTGSLQTWPTDGKPIVSPALVTDEELYPRHEPASNLVDCILGNAPNRSPGTIGLEAMKVIEGTCRSARAGNRVTFAC